MRGIVETVALQIALFKIMTRPADSVLFATLYVSRAVSAREHGRRIFLALLE